MKRPTVHHEVKRSELVEFHRYCPERPYVELKVPDNCGKVVSVTFNILSRDQGWADQGSGTSFTSFSATVHRPQGRPDIRPTNILENCPVNPEFFHHIKTWSLKDKISRCTWVKALEADDIIQVCPKSTYLAWINFVKEASINVEYEPSKDTEGPQPGKLEISNAGHFKIPLDPEKREIRLFAIEPGVFDEPVIASFSRGCLSVPEAEIPEFHALSYCWNSSGAAGTITIQSTESAAVDGEPKQPFYVSPSVLDALRRLRRPKKPLKIWIDSVCINQEDLTERGQQVSFMGDIYSSAEAVHIWLGEKDEGTAACLRLIRDIFNFNHRICSGGNDCKCKQTSHVVSLEDVDRAIRRKKGESSFRGMHEVFDLAQKSFSFKVRDLASDGKSLHLQVLMLILFNHRWFSRVWVVQEVILSRRASVHCANEAIPWKELVQVCEWLESPRFTRQHDHIKAHPSMAQIWKTLARNRRKRHHGTETEAADHPLPNILDTIVQGIELKATDPRDKIFALLPFGLETSHNQHLDPLIRPIYEKSVERVFCDFTRWWIRTNKSLSILSLIHCQPGRAWQNTLGPLSGDLVSSHPSWCIWSEGCSKWGHATLESQFDFQATVRKPDLDLLENSDPLVLFLSGREVSRIQAIGHPPANQVYAGHAEREELSQVFDKIIDPRSTTGAWAAKSAMAGKETSAYNTAADLMDHVRAHWIYFSRPKLTSLAMPNDSRQVRYQETDRLPTCINECFFVTSDGFFGLCPWTAKVGDVIALLAGGKVPYLLRPAGGSAGENFSLVGECYVSGIMRKQDRSKHTVPGSWQVFRLV